MDSLTPTSGAQWRKHREEGVLLRLPFSGLVGQFRSIQVDTLIKTGRIPDFLTGMIADLMDSRETKAPKPETMQQLAENVEFVHIAVSCAFVYPRVVEHPTTDDEISIEDVDWQDQMFILQFIGASAAALERFRQKQALHVGALDDVQADEPDAQQGDAH